jgi:hypothetical protein
MINTGRDRLKKTFWLRSQARAIGSHIASQRQVTAAVQELWFSDFARRSEFDRVIREVARKQPAEQRA